MNDSNEMAMAALNFTSNLLVHNHQGVIDCVDKIVVYCNGVKHGPESLMSHLCDIGLDECIEVAFDEERESCWAVVATNYQRAPIDCDEINNFLWADVPNGAQAYKSVQFVPVATIPPHWENDYLKALAKAK